MEAFWITGVVHWTIVLLSVTSANKWVLIVQSMQGPAAKDTDENVSSYFRRYFGEKGAVRRARATAGHGDLHALTRGLCAVLAGRNVIRSGALWFLFIYFTLHLCAAQALAISSV